MGNKQYAAQQLAERFVDQREIQNVMGKYMFTTMICKDADVAARFWSKKAPEPALGLNDGWYVGLDAVSYTHLDVYKRQVLDRTLAAVGRLHLGGHSGAHAVHGVQIASLVVDVHGGFVGVEAQGLSLIHI